MSGKPIPLRGTVGPDQNNSPFDVLTVKDALGRLGAYSLDLHGFSPEPTKALFHAIKFHQDGRNLKVDGIIAPERETARNIGKLLELAGARSLGFRCIKCGGFHGDMYGTRCCEKCTHKMFPDMLPTQIMGPEDDSEEISPEADE